MIVGVESIPTITFRSKNESEIRNSYIVRKALVEVLKKVHSGSQVVVYIQDATSTGQTVIHEHEQVGAIDPKTVGLIWTAYLYGAGRVSPEEMKDVIKKFRDELEQKIKEMTLFEQKTA